MSRRVQLVNPFTSPPRVLVLILLFPAVAFTLAVVIMAINPVAGYDYPVTPLAPPTVTRTIVHSPVDR
jgi:hypothetical protein